PTRTGRTCAPAWLCRAARPCARSARLAGDGGAGGRAHRTTSTSPRTGSDDPQRRDGERETCDRVEEEVVGGRHDHERGPQRVEPREVPPRAARGEDDRHRTPHRPRDVQAGHRGGEVDQPYPNMARAEDV